MAIRDEVREYYPDGRSRLIRPALIANFGEQALGVETYEGFDGDPAFTGIRGGGYYDTEKAQQKNRWTDEERELVEERLLEIASNGPRADEYRAMMPEEQPIGFGDVRLYEEPKPEIPFPGYDKLAADKAVRITADLGCEPQTLAYELANKNRKQVVEAVRELIDMKQAEQELTASA
jgi:hypothetical protein